MLLFSLRKKLIKILAGETIAVMLNLKIDTSKKIVSSPNYSEAVIKPNTCLVTNFLIENNTILGSFDIGQKGA